MRCGGCRGLPSIRLGDTGKDGGYWGLHTLPFPLNLKARRDFCQEAQESDGEGTGHRALKKLGGLGLAGSEQLQVRCLMSCDHYA